MATDEQANGNGPELHVAPSPHAMARGQTTRRLMLDVLIGLVPVFIMAVVVFRHYAVIQVTIAIVSCLIAEWLFVRLRGRQATLGDLSAVVTGAILGLSLPWSAPWYVGVIGGFAAIGFGKVVYGGLGQNMFNPAMVGRAFVMIAFPAALGAAAFVNADITIDAVTQATPLTAAKMAAGNVPAFLPMFIGTTNGCLGETSALACLLGGLYLCWRRTASWEVPVGAIVAVIVLGGLGNLLGLGTGLTVLQHLAGGSFMFGAFFIATDPVSNPLTPKGKLIFGAGFGALVVLLRLFSAYPEGVMFAVLLMNSVVPLINRASIPTPVGGPVPERKKA